MRLPLLILLLLAAYSSSRLLLALILLLMILLGFWVAYLLDLYLPKSWFRGDRS